MKTVAAAGTNKIADLSTTNAIAREEKIDDFTCIAFDWQRCKRSIYLENGVLGLPWPYGMVDAAQNWLIQIYIAIPDLQIETAIRIGTYPSLVLDCCALAAKV